PATIVSGRASGCSGMSSSATPRHCEERSDQAIQNIAVILDCFASLAMTRAILHLQFVSILTIIVSVPTMRRGGQRALLCPCMNVRTPRERGTQHAGADRRQPPHRDAGSSHSPAPPDFLCAVPRPGQGF